MTEEEKEAIEYLQAYIKNDKEDIKILNNTIDDDIDYYTEVEPIQKRVKYLETIKNLIEKLQKEKNPTKFYACDPNKHKECKKHNCYVNGGQCDATIDETKAKYIKLEDYIPKDKIREKIEELENNKENYIFKNLTSEDIRRTIITNYKELLEEE